MKRIIILFICMLMLLSVTSCGSSDTVSSGKPTVVCTTFPQYDWTMQILGEKAAEWDVGILLDSGTDLHSFQPAAEDILTIINADLFVYVGGGSDGWVEDIFKTTSSDAKRINLMRCLGEDLLETGYSYEHGHQDKGEDEHNEFCDHVHDEHIWLSIENAEEFCEAICKAICDIDKKNILTYKANCEIYTEKLEKLEEKYENAVESSKFKTLVFADRYPFAYLCEDLELHVHAAFSGCSSETEASFETIVELSEEIDELGLDSVVVIEGSDNKLADTVISNTKTKNQKIVVLNSLQLITRSDIEKGINYLSVMEENLNALKEALN